MRYYYENTSGEHGVFSEKNMIKAIFSAWNIEADLYIIPPKINLNDIKKGNVKLDLIFSSWESNKVNSELLKKYGYYEADGYKERHIFRLSDNKKMDIDWSETRNLIR